MPWGTVSCISKTACFLANYAHFPSSLEGMWSHKAPSRYRSLNGANGLGRNPDSSHRFWPQPIRGLPTIEPECSDIARERDVILPIKGKCVHALKALRSDIWLLALGLCLGDPVLCS